MSTLGTMTANVRRNLGETTANYYTDAEIQQYIGQGFQFYYMPMVEEGEGYFETTVNLSIVSGTETISLASLSSPFFSISQLERRLSNGSTMPLRPNQRRFKMNNNVAVTSGDAYMPTYKLRGTNLVLEPTPTASETGSSTAGLKLDYNYIPTFPTSSTATTFTFDANFPTNYEPMVELYATIAALEAKDAMGGVSDIASFRQRKAEWEAKFMDSLSNDETPEQVEYIGNNYNRFY